MLQSSELPLSEVIDGDQWQEIFDAHEIDFGNDEDSVYTPAITLWALISQAFFKGEMRSCKAAVGRVASLWATLGKTVCSTNTGAYCRARSKITWQAVRDICCQIAESAESVFDQQDADAELTRHDAVADAQSVSTTGRILLVDGFTVTAADTVENQEVFPQNPSQKDGLGFPIIRGVSLISMVTGLLIELVLGPYAGKQSGETALMWQMLDQPGFRSKKFTIATTMLQREVFTRNWLMSVYRSRWLVELDIRSIKCSLDMDIVRAKTPAMVRTEIWSCLLAYNLIRMKMLQSCAANGRMPRTLSFTTTMQLLANNWILASVMLTKELVELGQQTSASEVVGNRPDRVEPRANKRRPKVLALLNKPRHIAKAELFAAA